MPIDFDGLEPDDRYFVRLERNVWLMDDHKWAICAWEALRREANADRIDLVHVDYHWDGCDDYLGERAAQHILRHADLPALREIVLADQYIRLDSFIAAAVRRRMLRRIHFLCRQDDTEIGINRDLLRLGGARQYVHADVLALNAAEVEAPYVFDLCLDYFSDSDQMGSGPVWSDADVLDVVEPIRPLVEGAGAVTVSLSFDYSGSGADTRHLAQLVLPLVQAWRLVP
jgi:hypothetical protein